MNGHIFSLGWWDHDESQDWLFYHEEKTEQQFEKDVNLLLKKYGVDYLAGEHSYATINYLLRFIATKLPELGYESIKPISYGFAGSIIGRQPEKEKEIRKVVGAKWMAQARRHNKEIDREVLERRQKRAKKV